MADAMQDEVEPDVVSLWVDAVPEDAGDDTRGGPMHPHPVPVEKFLYIGRALTADEFTDYVESYDIGTVPPDFVVIHHTGVPYTVQTARAQPPGWVWDANEQGLSEAEIKAKRLKKLEAMREYYRNTPTLHWDRGPHLFIDDRYIYLFTPMYDIGIHANAGNGTAKHYSVGIEVVGSYDFHQWPEETARLVGHAVAVMQAKWKTFQLTYKPWSGGISMHRDYTDQKTCPGNRITPDYFIPIFREAHARLTAAPFSADSPLLGGASGSREALARYLKRTLPDGHEYSDADVDLILGYYWKHAPAAGVDPFLAVIHSIQESNGWQSPEAARPHRNPAKLGQGEAPGGFQSFATWELAAQAHLTFLQMQGQSGKRLRDMPGADGLLAKAQEVARG